MSTHAELEACWKNRKKACVAEGQGTKRVEAEQSLGGRGWVGRKSSRSCKTFYFILQVIANYWRKVFSKGVILLFML